MAQNVHPQAPHHLPGFLPGADGSDLLFTLVAIMVIVIVLALGVVYFTIHALPEKLAHKANSTQLQLIGILSLLALFTHNNFFWVFALLLAAVRMPDIVTPLDSISQSLKNLIGRDPTPMVSAPALVEPRAARDKPPLKPSSQSGEQAEGQKRTPASPIPQSGETPEKREG